MDTQKIHFDLSCIGNAIVDSVAFVSEDFLQEMGVQPGSMNLIGEEKLLAIQEKTEIRARTGGGSVANTAYIAQKLGLKTAYFGTINEADAEGRAFIADLREAGIHPHLGKLPESGKRTAQCVVLVTGDGQRTMFTYLGACGHFCADHLEADILSRSNVLYLEGYLYDLPQAKEACEKAADTVCRQRGMVALTLSDVFCIERHREDFLRLLQEKVDLVFANEAELLSLFPQKDFDEALLRLGRLVPHVVITRSGAGATLLIRGQEENVSTEPVKVVDTTGAGDAFAAGYLAGLVQGFSPVECAILGNRTAGHVIQLVGARPASEWPASAGEMGGWLRRG